MYKDTSNLKFDIMVDVMKKVKRDIKLHMSDTLSQMEHTIEKTKSNGNPVISTTDKGHILSAIIKVPSDKADTFESDLDDIINDWSKLEI